MISWFQRVFGKHFKWVLLAFLGVLLVSFIVSIGAVPQMMGRQGGKAQTQMFLDVDLNDAGALQQLASEVQSTLGVLYGYQITSGQELERLVEYRIIEKHLADEWHIPDPSAQQLETFLKSLPIFQGPDGRFDVETYQKFKDNVDASPNRDVQVALLKEEYRLARVRSIVGGPNYAIPAMAQWTVALNDAKSDIVTATLDYKSFTPKLDLTGDKLTATLQQIFDKDPTRFPLPAQMNMTFVKFPAAAVPTPTPAQLQDYAQQHKDAFPGVNPLNLSDKDKTTVTDAWRAAQKTQVLTDAANQSRKFAREYLDLKSQLGATPKPDSPQFKALLAKYHLTLQTLPTLIQGQPAPDDSPIPNDTLQDVAGTLGPQSPMQAVPLDDGAAVLFYVDSLPSRPATFDQAKDQVLKAYTDAQKVQQFAAHAQALRDAVAKDMAAGKSFAEAAEAAGFTVKDYTGVTLTDINTAANNLPFSADGTSTPGTGPLASMTGDVMQALVTSANSGSVSPLFMTLRVGELSPVVPTNNLGVLFVVTKREAGKVAADSPDLQKMNEAFEKQANTYTTYVALENQRQAILQAMK